MREDRRTTREAYLEGFNSLDACEYHRFEATKAAADWKAAADQHEHTSYYGYQHVRNMRAWWLGVLRKQRASGLGWHTHHAADRLDLEPAREASARG